MLIVSLEKRSLRRLDSDVIKSQLTYIARRALAGSRGKVWSLVKAVKAPEPHENGEGYMYTTSLKFERTGKRASPAVITKQEGIIAQMVENAGRGKGWLLPESTNGELSQKAIQPKTRIYAPADLVRDDLNREVYFRHLFKRDSQISLVQSALDAYISSGFEHRFHAVLFGEPASGKTEILRSFARMLGEEAVLTFDATSTTKAGAERILLETERIPPVLIVEEVEKTDEHSLRWLLGVLDHRAEIRKVNFRTVAAKSVKLLCLATVNDMALFNKMMDGALASRFSHKIYCPRPDRDVLQKILEREIEHCKGRQEWIKPALDWCLEQEKTNDPRRVITVCLSGRDQLLTGTYQQHLKDTMIPKN